MHIVILGYAGHFVFLTSDGFSASSDISTIEDTAAGGFHVQLLSSTAPGFNQYFQQLSPQNSNNPWLKQLWKQSFNCEEEDIGMLSCGMRFAYNLFDKSIEIIFSDSYSYSNTILTKIHLSRQY